MNFFSKAADSLPGHWHQEEYGDGNGNFCAAGHVWVALGVDKDEVVSEDFFEPSVPTGTWEVLNAAAKSVFPSRTDALSPFVADVNDHPDTTEDDMVIVLTKAAQMWDERSALRK